jgi:multidrug efflux pump subunit AcrA (membrane-fusion protein)
LPTPKRRSAAATLDLDRTIVRTPVDGVVVVRNVSVGQIVTVGDGAPILYRIATDLRHLELEVDVAPTDLAGFTRAATSSSHWLMPTNQNGTAALPVSPRRPRSM